MPIPASFDIIQRFRADTLVVDGDGLVTQWTDTSSSALHAVPYDSAPPLIAADPNFAGFPSVDFRRTGPGDARTLMLRAHAASFGLDEITWGFVMSLDQDGYYGATGYASPIGTETLTDDVAGDCASPFLLIDDGTTDFDSYFLAADDFEFAGHPGDQYYNPGADPRRYARGRHDGLIVGALPVDGTRWWIDATDEYVPTGHGSRDITHLDALTIGGMHASGGRTFFQGRIAEVVVWPRALTDDERGEWNDYVHSRYVQGLPDGASPTVPGDVSMGRSSITSRVTARALTIAGQVSKASMTVTPTIGGSITINPQAN